MSSVRCVNMTSSPRAAPTSVPLCCVSGSPSSSLSPRSRTLFYTLSSSTDTRGRQDQLKPSAQLLAQLERDVAARDRAHFPLPLATLDWRAYENVRERVSFMNLAHQLRSQAETIDLVLCTPDGGHEPVHRYMIATRARKLWATIVTVIEEEESSTAVAPSVSYTNEQMCMVTPKVVLQGFDRRTLSIVVSGIYGQRTPVSFSYDLAFRLMKLGAHYQLNFLLDSCARLLGRSISLANCCLLLQVGLKFQMSLAHRAYTFIVTNFGRLLSTAVDDFAHLSLAQLSTLLADNRLNVAHETQVWRAIVLWIECNPQRRLRHFWRLFGRIRFNLIAKPAALKQIVDEFAMMNAHYGNALVAMLERAGGWARVRLNLRLYNPRVANQVAMLYGGYQQGYPSNTLKVFDWREGRWYEMSLHHQFQRVFHQVVSIGRRLYVIGGFDGHVPRNQLLQIDLATAGLELKQPMSLARMHFAAVNLHNTIVVLGGHNASVRFRCVEQWNPWTNTWRPLPPMSMQRSSLAACVLNDKIYVAGGIDMFVTSNVEFYSSRTNSWTLVGFMNVPRRNFQLVPFQGQLWAIGGFINYDQDNRGLKTVERLDLATNTWHWAPAMKRARASFTSVVIEGDKLFVFGGYNGTRSYRSIELYTPSLGEWRLVSWQANLASPLSGTSGCVLTGLANTDSYTYYGQCLVRPKKYVRRACDRAGHGSDKALLAKFRKAVLKLKT